MKKFITLPEECTDIRASNYNWRFKFLHFYRDGDRFGYVEVGDERHIEEYIPAFRNTQDLQMKCFKCFGNRVSLNKTKEIYKGIDKVAETSPTGNGPNTAPLYGRRRRKKQTKF